MIFDELRDSVNSVVNNFNDILTEAMMDSEASIIDLNIDQIEHGIGGDGLSIGEYASEEYSQVKQAMGSKAPFGMVDLKLEGDFIDGIFIDKFNSSLGPSLRIDSRDGKTEKLESKYHNIWGIAPENEGLQNDEDITNIQKRIIDEIIR